MSWSDAKDAAEHAWNAAKTASEANPSDTTLSAVLTTKENELNTAKGDLVSALDLYLARFVL